MCGQPTGKQAWTELKSSAAAAASASASAGFCVSADDTAPDGGRLAARRGCAGSLAAPPSGTAPHAQPPRAGTEAARAAIDASMRSSRARASSTLAATEREASMAAAEVADRRNGSAYVQGVRIEGLARQFWHAGFSREQRIFFSRQCMHAGFFALLMPAALPALALVLALALAVWVEVEEGGLLVWM